LKSWRQLFGLLLALAWMPMVHSCEIAHALGIELPQQGEQSQSQQSPADNCDHCTFCETMHAGGLAPSVVKVSVPGFVALLPLWQPVLTTLAVEQSPKVAAVTRTDQDSPPQRWQFAERTALPPRAPSLLA
jgi:hypothetical protein